MPFQPLKMDMQARGPDRTRVALQRIFKWARQFADAAIAILTVKGPSGSPTVANVVEIDFSDASVTDNTGGRVTVTVFPAGSTPAVWVRYPDGTFGWSEVSDYLTKDSFHAWDADAQAFVWVPTTTECPE